MMDPDAPAPDSRLRAARWLASAALFALVVALAARQWAAAPVALWRPQPAWLAVAAVALAAHFVLATEAWRRWLALLGAPIPFAAAFRALFLSNVAKYLPGGGWNYLDRALRLRGLGVGAAVATGSMALDLAGQLAAALIVAQLAPAAGGVPFAAWWGPLIALAIVSGLHPRVLGSAFGLAERLTGRPFPRPTYRYGAMLGQLGLYLIAWTALGAGFAALAAGLSPVPLGASQAIALVGAFPLAWAAGTLAVFFPAGLGVREGALALLLTSVVPAPWPMALALAARLWLTLGDLVAFAAAALGASRVRAEDAVGTKDA